MSELIEVCIAFLLLEIVADKVGNMKVKIPAYILEIIEVLVEDLERFV